MKEENKNKQAANKSASKNNDTSKDRAFSKLAKARGVKPKINTSDPQGNPMVK